MFRALTYSLCTSHTIVLFCTDDEEFDQPVIRAASVINLHSNALLSEPPPFEDIANLLEPTKPLILHASS